MLKSLRIVAATSLMTGMLFAGDDVQQLAGDNSAFAFNLYGQLGKTEGNLFFSPYSISTALAMTAAGARGKTASEMNDVLHFSLPPEKVNPAFAGLGKLLGEAEGDGKVTLAMANSMWPSNRYKILDDYTQLLKTDYDVAITPLDYTKIETARTTINEWVAHKTQDKIKDLIGPKDLVPSPALVLVNAIYFQGKWQHRFNPKATEPASFLVNPTRKEDVAMMSQTSTFPYADLASFRMLELPYRGDDLSMLVLLPEGKSGLDSLEGNLSPSHLRQWRGQLVESPVQVFLPKFKISWGTENLVAPLQALGMREAFRPMADFSGISSNPQGLYIGTVLHKAFIEVREEGTEAAAATAVVALPGGMAPLTPTVVFRVDRPFLFLIQEKTTGSILFMGRVEDPKAGEKS